MNAKDEFLKHISNRKLLCSTVSISSRKNEYEKTSILTTGWAEADWIEFLSEINVEYDEGYGGQETFGTIWYVDGTWSSREEYDGSEWWQYNKCPEIPKDLNRIDKVRDQKLNQILGFDECYLKEILNKK